MTAQLYLHPDKTVLQLTGDDPGNFLNELLTAQIEKLEEDIARATCLLSPQGRILFDMLVVRKGSVLYLITEKVQAENLIRRLTLYRLRRAIDITPLAEISVCHLLDSDNSRQIAPHATLPHSAIIATDERHKELGLLCLIPETDLPTAQPDKFWHIQRIGLGIPEGVADLTPNRSLILEAGLQHLEAVDFKKGCYVGQEVTARTHYRGLVKRRLFPITAPTNTLETGASVFMADKIVGQCGSVANEGEQCIALASIRLDAAKQVIEKDAVLSLEDGTSVQLKIAEWMHPLPGFDSEEG
jgi:folate-binding protein YgfZ